jgi:tRNA dimethylallyltransferase
MISHPLSSNEGGPVGISCELEEIERIYLGLALEAEKQLVPNLQKPKKKVIVIAGPTAVGKSAFAIELAKLLHGEIISADSMQVYRGMDIGTAKLPLSERQEIPHHLIDIRDVRDVFNVVDFYYEARHLCQEIIARGSVPIVVGGSGFYLHSLIYGPPSGPPSVLELRKNLEEELKLEGVDAMYEKLKQLDPQYAATITKGDKQKIIRAIEIIKLTGKKVSKLSWKSRRKPQNYEFHCWFLYKPKDHLYRQIDKRCEKMLQDGFLDEVSQLESQGLRENTSAAQSIGYRQALDYLETKGTKEDYKSFVEKFKQSTRNYAKRQLTWFRKEPTFRWLDLCLHDFEVAVDMVIQDYHL